MPFLLFRFVMLQAYRQFHLRVSAGELWRNLPLIVHQDVLIALILGAALALVEWLGGHAVGRIATFIRNLSWVLLAAVVLLIAGLYVVYLELGFFPTLATLREYAAPDSPVWKSVAGFVSWNNAALLCAIGLAPLIIRGLARRYRRLARAAGAASIVLLIAGFFWTAPPTLVDANLHPLSQIYDGLAETAPDWDIDKWGAEPVSWRSISGTYAAEDHSEWSGAFADCSIVLVLLESVSRQYLVEDGEWRFPNFARLAAGGMNFSNYYTPGDASLSSVFALFAARGPVPLRASRWYQPPARRILWPLKLRQRGYRTGFFHSNEFGAFFDKHLFDAMQWNALEDASAIARAYGMIPQDSSRLGEVLNERSTVQRVFEFVTGARADDQPVLACYYTAIPHLPYDFRNRTEHALHKGKHLTRFESYENELAYVDAVLGDLYDQLQAQGFFDRGLLIVTADHGEAFGQHPGVVVHSTHVYQENVHVPLLLVNPRRFAGQTNPNPGNHVDLWPTLADLLGFDVPDWTEGTSLLTPSRHQMVFVASVENGVKAGVIDNRYKFILDRRDDSAELYDLGADPGERTNLVAEHPQLADRYRQWIHRRVATELAAAGDENHLAFATHLQIARERLAARRFEEARAHFEEALEIDPDSSEAWLGLAETLEALKLPDQAEAARRRGAGP